jgi:hypothetical protein
MEFFLPKGRPHLVSFYLLFEQNLFTYLDAHLCFGRDRYKILMRALRFDDKLKRLKTKDNKWEDKFVHIRTVR